MSDSPSASPLWSWRCDNDGNVTICIQTPTSLDIPVSRRDIESMERAGSPEMRAAYANVQRWADE